MIVVEHKRKSLDKLHEKYPGAHILDITSKATNALVKLRPFFPHGDIPIPFSPGNTAMSVEGIWQGLKVFEGADVDLRSFENSTMKNLKRTIRRYGLSLGHRKGINGTILLSYIDARIEIYLPSYLCVLENKVQRIMTRVKEESMRKDMVLLDYTTNSNVKDPNSPLSHAYLVKAYVEGTYPSKDSLD